MVFNLALCRTLSLGRTLSLFSQLVSSCYLILLIFSSPRYHHRLNPKQSLFLPKVENANSKTNAPCVRGVRFGFWCLTRLSFLKKDGEVLNTMKLNWLVINLVHRKLGLFGFVFVVSPTQFAENLCAVWHGTNSGVFFRLKWGVWFRLTLHFTDNDRNYKLSLWAFCKEGRLVSFVFNSAFGSP